MIATIRRELRDFFGPLHPTPMVAFLVAGVVLTLYHYFGRSSFFGDTIGPKLNAHFGWSRQEMQLFRCLYWCLMAWPLYVGIPWLAMRYMARRRPDYPLPSLGWGVGDWKLGVKVCALFYGVMFVILLGVIFSGEFRGKYPLCTAAQWSLTNFVVYEIALIGYFICWEWLWRGFLQFSLERQFGAWVVFINLLPFVVAHFDNKPFLESASSIAGGLALGWLALRTRSFWYGAFIHAATDLTLDSLMVFGVRGGFGN